MQPAGNATAPNFIPKRADEKTVAFYKAIQDGKKHITQANKEIKCTHWADAVKNLKISITAVEPFAACKSGLPQSGGRPFGPDREQVIASAYKCTENAMGELDYSMLDNAYRNLVQAVFILAPYA